MDQDGKNIKLDEAEIIKMGSLRKILDLVFQLEGLGRAVQLIEIWIKGGIMPELPWYAGEESIQRLKDIRMLTWLYHVNLNPPPWEGPEKTFFIMTEKQTWEGSRSIFSVGQKLQWELLPPNQDLQMQGGLWDPREQGQERGGT